jgi:hypothetical protein
VPQSLSGRGGGIELPIIHLVAQCNKTELSRVFLKFHNSTTFKTVRYIYDPVNRGP